MQNENEQVWLAQPTLEQQLASEKPIFINTGGVKVLAGFIATTTSTPERLAEMWRLRGQRGITNAINAAGILFEYRLHDVVDQIIAQAGAYVSRPALPVQAEHHVFLLRQDGNPPVLAFQTKTPTWEVEQEYDELLILTVGDRRLLVAIEAKNPNDKRAGTTGGIAGRISPSKTLKGFFDKGALRAYVDPLKAFITAYNREHPDVPLDGYACIVLTNQSALRILERSEKAKDFTSKLHGMLVGTDFTYDEFLDFTADTLGLPKEDPNQGSRRS